VNIDAGVGGQRFEFFGNGHVFYSIPAIASKTTLPVP